MVRVRSIGALDASHKASAEKLVRAAAAMDRDIL